MISRLPSEEKNISEIEENDKRVRIVGIVIDMGEDYLIIDDGTGKIEVILKERIDVKTGDKVKVIGKITVTEGKLSLLCECIQILKNFNLKLYKEAKDIVKKVMKNV